MGYNADTCYCIALCHYMLKEYAAALKYITEIIERGIKEYPGIIILHCIALHVHSLLIVQY